MALIDSDYYGDNPNNTTANMVALYREVDWLKSTALAKLSVASPKQDGHEQHWIDIPPPDTAPGSHADMLIDWELNVFERLALAFSNGAFNPSRCTGFLFWS
ncbi:hypothetical protein P4S64_13510 [Vibrio sp. M60_M31a]